MFDEGIETIKPAIINAEVLAVERNKEADEGLVITFNNGTVLTIGFSSCEGYINTKQISIYAP